MFKTRKNTLNTNNERMREQTTQKDLQKNIIFKHNNILKEIKEKYNYNYYQEIHSKRA